MSGLIIRRAERSDLEAISAIENGCFASDRLSRRQIRYLLASKTALILVAMVGSVVVGCCIGLLPKAPRPGRIYSLAVLPDYRGRDIGRQLLEQMLDAMRQRDYCRCRLEVRATDAVAQALYRQQGFCEVAQLQGYYEDGGDALKMELALGVTAENALSLRR